MVSIAEVRQARTISFTKAVEPGLARRRFSLKETLLTIACLPLLPVILPLLIWSACYQEKKLEESL